MDGLDYDAALDHFAAMFPSINRTRIGVIINEHEGRVEAALEKLLAIQASDTPPSYEECTKETKPKTPPRSQKPKLRPCPIKPELPAFCAEAEASGASNSFRTQQMEDDEKLARRLQRCEIFQFQRQQREDQNSPTHVPLSSLTTCAARSPPPPSQPTRPSASPDQKHEATNTTTSSSASRFSFGHLPSTTNEMSEPESSWLVNAGINEAPTSSKLRNRVSGWFKSRSKQQRQQAGSSARNGNLNRGFKLSDSS